VLALGLVLILTAASLPGVRRAVDQYEANTAVQSIALQVRQGRALAVDQRRVHLVTFSGARTITLSRIEGDNPVEVRQLDLPATVSFTIEQGVAATGEEAPDGYTASSAVDFNRGSVIRFRPDGSAVDATGQFCNGVAYCAIPGDSSTARAVSLFGATGRVRIWRWVLRGTAGGEWK